jgi:hypothetical protein
VVKDITNRSSENIEIAIITVDMEASVIQA